MAQTEFDRQAEVTRLLLEGISSTHVSPTFVFRWVLPQATEPAHRLSIPSLPHPPWCLENGLSERRMGTGHVGARG